jgi:thiamine-monophosphate kinase
MRSEFEFIKNIKERYGLGKVGDDCAVVRKDVHTDLVITADLLVEDIDFRLEWTTPECLGHKSLAVSLSDVAAMGGSPKWAMLALGVPEHIWNGNFVDKFYEGWFGLARKHRVELIGGDISRTAGHLVIDSIVGGDVRKGKAVMRTGARPGDSLFVTGALGGAAGGLSLLENGTRQARTRGAKRSLLDRQLRPVPRVEIGEHLARNERVTSMLDISDGLAADVYHLCHASNVGAVIELEAIPTDECLSVLTNVDPLAFALGGGEDFELLFTSARKKLSGRDLTPITRIGQITSNAGIVEVAGREGANILPDLGYRHF